MKDTWNIVRANFESDDGSLPGIDISNLDSKAVRLIFDFFLEHSVLTKADSDTADIQRKVHDVLDGNSVSFQYCIEGVRYAGHMLPVGSR